MTRARGAAPVGYQAGAAPRSRGGRPLCRRLVFGAVLLAVAAPFLAARAGDEGPARPLRVCADPDNLPFSNERGEGFENKLAELVARELGTAVAYTWWPDRRGFIANTLRVGRCDVVMGVPNGYELVRWTRPYYRSTYVFVSARDGEFRVRSWDDPVLGRARIGVVAGTPPGDALVRKGLIRNVVSYRLTIDLTSEHPGQIVEDVAGGRIDVAIVWGPIAGYFARKQRVPLDVVPVPALPELPVPLTYEISMGVRRADVERQRTLDEILDRKQAEVSKILLAYGVPTVEGPLVRKPEEIKRGVVGERYQQ